MDSEAQVVFAVLIIVVFFIIWKKGEDDGNR